MLFEFQVTWWALDESASKVFSVQVHKRPALALLALINSIRYTILLFNIGSRDDESTAQAY